MHLKLPLHCIPKFFGVFNFILNFICCLTLYQHVDCITLTTVSEQRSATLSIPSSRKGLNHLHTQKCLHISKDFELGRWYWSLHMRTNKTQNILSREQARGNLITHRGGYEWRSRCVQMLRVGNGIVRPATHLECWQLLKARSSREVSPLRCLEVHTWLAFRFLPRATNVQCLKSGAVRQSDSIFFFTPTLCYLPQQPQEAAFVALLQNSVLNNLGPMLGLFFCFHYDSYSSHNCLSKVYLSQREGHLSLIFYFICLKNLHNHLSRSATNICNKNLFYELQQLLKLTYQIVDVQLLKHVHISRNLHLISYFIILIESACFLRYLDISY